MSGGRGGASTRSGKGNRPVFLGQTTIDVYPLFDIDPSDIRPDSLTLRQGARDSRQLTIHYQDPPLVSGGKVTAREPFHNYLTEDAFLIVPGGGVFNSYLGYIHLGRRFGGTETQPFYIDMSIPMLNIGKKDLREHVSLLTQALQEQFNTNSLFCNAREMPVNLVLADERADKKILKSSIPPGWGLQEHYRRSIRGIIAESDAVLQNSMKDRELVEIVGGSARKGALYSVVTKSLPWDFVREKILPLGTVIFNYDELGSLLYGGEFAGDENERIDLGAECIERIRREGLSERPIHVTLGRNGVLVSDTAGIHHVRLRPGKQEFVQEGINRMRTEGLKKYRKGEISRDDYIKRYIKGTTGAGDVYAATVFFHETRLGNRCLTEVACHACLNAIEYIGYPEPLTPEDFVVERRPSVTLVG